MNINIEYLNGNKTIGLFFLRSEAVIPDRFKNLILLIDGLSFGTFGFHPHEGFEDELILYIQKTNERVKTLFVKIDLNGIKFGFLRTHFSSGKEPAAEIGTRLHAISSALSILHYPQHYPQPCQLDTNAG